MCCYYCVFKHISFGRSLTSRTSILSRVPDCDVDAISNISTSESKVSGPVEESVLKQRCFMDSSMGARLPSPMLMPAVSHPLRDVLAELVSGPLFIKRRVACWVAMTSYDVRDRPEFI